MLTTILPRLWHCRSSLTRTHQNICRFPSSISMISCCPATVAFPESFWRWRNLTRPTSTARSTSIAPAVAAHLQAGQVDRSELSASRIRSSGHEHCRKPAAQDLFTGERGLLTVVHSHTGRHLRSTPRPPARASSTTVVSVGELSPRLCGQIALNLGNVAACRRVVPSAGKMHADAPP